MEMNFDLDASALKQWAARMEDGIIDVVKRAMNEQAERTMTRSKNDYCPVDTGALRASGQVDTEAQGSVVTSELGYGGESAPYAIYVHEINKNYRGGKQWKYLETPLKEDLPAINDSIADAVREFVEKG